MTQCYGIGVLVFFQELSYGFMHCFSYVIQSITLKLRVDFKPLLVGWRRVRQYKCCSIFQYEVLKHKFSEIPIWKKEICRGRANNNVKTWVGREMHAWFTGETMGSDK